MKLDFKVNWEPLEWLCDKYPNLINCGDYMYMGTSVAGSICLYKHRITRGYLNIDTDGTCWLYHKAGYFQIAQESAIERATG